MRIVVKIGTNSLLGADKTLDLAMIASMAGQVHALRKRGIQVVLVSSGAVGAGRALWSGGRKIKDSVLEKQVLSAIGQTHLIQGYNEALAEYGMIAAQLLVTKHDFRHRRQCIILARLLERLMNEKHILPILNENDSLAVEELVFTDNDELAGLIAPQIGADRLIILSDVDGVYDEQKRVIPVIDFAQGVQVNTSLMTGGGRGGMASKLATAKKMAQAGIMTQIARARTPDILIRLMDDEAVCTRILSRAKPKPVKRWLAAGLTDTQGRIAVNAKLAEKLRAGGKTLSILPVGITTVDTPFIKGDVVDIVDDKGKRIGHGIARYDAATLNGYKGKQKMPPFIHANELHVDG